MSISFKKSMRIQAVALTVLLGAACSGQFVTSPLGAIGAQSVGASATQKNPGLKGPLLYVSTRNGVQILTYPQGQLLGTFSANRPAVYLCADPNNGDVFVPQSGVIQRYAHGSTTVKASLGVPKNVSVLACSVDPSTGNLAVTCIGGSLKGGGVFVYKNASGQPIVYTVGRLRAVYPAYDNASDLFVIGYNNHNRFVLYQLTKGGNRLAPVALNSGYSVVTKDQWDGAYLTIGVSPAQILQVSVSGSSGSVVNNIQLNNAAGDLYYWIQDQQIVSASNEVEKNNNIGVGAWDYPAGGDPTKVFFGITKREKDYITDMTISVGKVSR